MLEIKVFGFELFEVLYNFFIFSFVGWVYECCYVSIRKRKWVNRGFLNGPIIPLYGIGATLIYISFGQYRQNYFLIFVGGMSIATILEYMTSLLMELIFHAKLWDYCDKKMNLNGRVCFSASILWGVLSICIIEIVHPFVNKLLLTIPKYITEFLIYIFLSLFVVDLTITIIHTLGLDRLLSELQSLRQDILDYLESKHLFETKEKWKNKWSILRFPEFVIFIRELIDENTDKLIEYNKTKDEFDLEKLHLESEKFMKEYIKKFQQSFNKISRVQKRLLNAFPGMHSIKRDEILSDIRNWLLKHKRDMR